MSPSNLIVELLESIHNEIGDVYYNNTKQVFILSQYFKSMSITTWLANFEVVNYSIIKNLTMFQIMEIRSCDSCQEM